MLVTILTVALSQETKYSFDAPAAPVPVIVTKLGKALNLDLVADEDLAVDIVVVHLNDATQKQALAWIAECIDAEWVRQGDRYRLTRSHATEVAQARAEREAKLIQIKERLALIPETKPLDQVAVDIIAKASLEASAEEGRSFRLSPELHARIPAQRFLLGIARQFDYARFLDMPSGTTIYLPFDQRSADARLPRSFRSLYQTYEREDRAYGAGMERMGAPSSPQGTYFEIDPGYWVNGPLKGAVQVSSLYGEVYLSLVLSWGERRMNVSLDPSRATASVPTAGEPRKEWDVPVSQSQLTKDFLALVAPRNFSPGGTPTKVPTTVLDFFLVDEDFDLFGLGTSDILVQAAQRLGKSLVACMPDVSAFQVRRMIGRPDMSLQAIMGSLLHPSMVVVMEDANALVIEPKRPVETREGRIPRPALRQIVRDAQRWHSDLTVYAELLAKSTSEGAVFDPRNSLSMVTRLVHLPQFYDDSKVVLKLYGSLSDAQRDRTKQGGLFLPWAGLSQDQREAWSHKVASEGQIGSPGKPNIEFGPGHEAVLERITAFAAAASSGRQPDGLFVVYAERPVLAGGSSSDQRIATQVIDGTSLSSMVASKELRDGNWNVDRFVVIPYTEITVFVRFDGKDMKLATYAEAYAHESTPTITYEQIPKAMIEARRAEIEEMKNRYGRIPPN